jgi:hypothetical protein
VPPLSLQIEMEYESKYSEDQRLKCDCLVFGMQSIALLLIRY